MTNWEVGPGIYRLTHGISNLYLVEREGKLTLVDAGVPRDWAQFLGTLRSLGRSLSDVDGIVLTHAHSDHTGFAERARRTGGRRVWVHELDERVAKGGTPEANEAKAGPYLRRVEAWRTLFGLLRTGGTRVVPILELSTYTNGTVLPVAGRPTAVHLPGHTAGSSALLFEDAGALFTGDSLVMRNPLTGRKGPQIMPRALNRSSREALASLSHLEPLPVRIVLPGHGEPWTEGIVSAVRKAREAGLS